MYELDYNNNSNNNQVSYK
ncbi:hypothetical protein P3W45_000988 [Vairimorpha bombi]